MNEVARGRAKSCLSDVSSIIMFQTSGLRAAAATSDRDPDAICTLSYAMASRSLLHFSLGKHLARH